MSDDKNKEQKGGSERDIKPPNTGKPRKTEPGGSRGIEPPKLLGAIPPWLDEND
jgi:hypothetical protein